MRIIPAHPSDWNSVLLEPRKALSPGPYGREYLDELRKSSEMGDSNCLSYTFVPSLMNALFVSCNGGMNEKADVKLSDACEEKSHSHLDLDSNLSEEKAIDGNVK